MSFDILEEGERHAIIESDDEEYLIEDRGYDEDEDVFLFEVLNDEVVSTVDNIESEHAKYPTPDQVEISSVEADQLDNYMEVVGKVAEKSSLIQGVSGYEELFSDEPLEDTNEENSEDPLQALDKYGCE